MFKKYYYFEAASLLLIPVTILLTGSVFSFINPEIAAGHPNYVRNYQILNLAKTLTLWTGIFISMALWFLTCFFLLKSREQSYWWSPLALFGPFGLTVLSMLGDKSPAPGDLFRQIIQRQRLSIRIVYEIIFFAAVWVLSCQIMVLKRNLLILAESVRTGVSTAQIIDRQNASSGMWAYTEGMEVLYLVAVFYVFWPLCFNLIARIPKIKGLFQVK